MHDNETIVTDASELSEHAELLFDAKVGGILRDHAALGSGRPPLFLYYAMDSIHDDPYEVGICNEPSPNRNGVHKLPRADDLAVTVRAPRTLSQEGMPYPCAIPL